MNGDGAASARDRLLSLLTTHSFARKKVTLASGRESDFFIDCKQTMLLAEGHALAGELMANELSRFGPHQAVAGVELGGCPLASAVALVTFQRGQGKDAIYVRKEVKDHGSKRQLEGNAHLPKGARVVLLEDVVTTGGSTLKAAAKLEDAGYQIAGVIALVDRQEGGAEAIAASFPFHALYTRADFIPEG